MVKYRILSAVALGSLSAYALVGCQSFSFPEGPWTSRRSESPSPSASSPSAKPDATTKQPPSQDTQDQLYSFYKFHIDPNSKLNDEDRKLLKDLSAQKQKTAWIEAVQVLGYFKGLNQSLIDDMANHSTEDSQSVSAPRSLHPGILSALEHNPLLHHPGVLVIVNAALANQNWQEESRNRIQEILASVDQSYGLVGRSQLASGAGPDYEEGQAQVEELNPADVHHADMLLTDALILAEQKMYRAALDKIAEIDEGSPLYEEAQNRKVALSQGAIQELRQKAATAYQKSIPVTDKQAKETYLKQARAYLQEAIDEFPDAEQLKVVRQNLSIIDREIERLNRSGERAY